MAVKKVNLAIDLVPEQLEAINVFKNNTVTVLNARAGCGKSAVTYSYLLHRLLTEKDFYVYITKPPTPVLGYDIGFLKGDKDEKLAPYNDIILKIFQQLFIGEGRDLNSKQKQLERIMKRVEFIEITFLRGETLGGNSVTVIDEAQNLNEKAVELLLGRIGNGSKVIFVGDVEQSDIKRSGFPKLIRTAEHVEGMERAELVVNHRSKIAQEALRVFQEIK